ncbi:unnamed protein product [Ectocarpus fasciculatus]
MFAAEVLFFYLSGPLIRRVGVRGVIALAQLAYLTRFVYYSVDSSRAVVGAAFGGVARPYLRGHVGSYHRLRAPNRSSSLANNDPRCGVRAAWGPRVGAGGDAGRSAVRRLRRQTVLRCERLFAIVVFAPASLPTARHWCKSRGVGGPPQTTGLVPRRKHSGDDGRMYELIGNVSARGSGNDSLLCGLSQDCEVETMHLARGPS